MPTRGLEEPRAARPAEPLATVDGRRRVLPEHRLPPEAPPDRDHEDAGAGEVHDTDDARDPTTRSGTRTPPFLMTQRLPRRVIGGHTVTDLHLHIQPWHLLTDTARALMEAPRDEEERHAIEAYQEDAGRFVEAMDAWGIERAALINYVAPDVMGFDRSVNDWVAAYCRDRTERLIAVGSVHPRIEADAGAVRAEVERLVSLGIRMLKLHPAHQIVWPDAYRADSPGHGGHPPDERPYGEALRALYEACERRGLPLMVHTGTSVFPGARNRMTDPLLLDDVALDHPRLRLVLAHAGRPLWGEAACFLARRHENVFLDLSGIPPQALRRYVPALPRIADKCLWGTDWPGPGLPTGAPRKNVETFLATELGLDPEQKAAILHENSVRLLSS